MWRCHSRGLDRSVNCNSFVHAWPESGGTAAQHCRRKGCITNPGASSHQTVFFVEGGLGRFDFGFGFGFAGHCEQFSDKGRCIIAADRFFVDGGLGKFDFGFGGRSEQCLYKARCIIPADLFFLRGGSGRFDFGFGRGSLWFGFGFGFGFGSDIGEGVRNDRLRLRLRHGSCRFLRNGSCRGSETWILHKSCVEDLQKWNIVRKETWIHKYADMALAQVLCSYPMRVSSLISLCIGSTSGGEGVWWRCHSTEAKQAKSDRGAPYIYWGYSRWALASTIVALSQHGSKAGSCGRSWQVCSLHLATDVFLFFFFFVLFFFVFMFFRVFLPGCFCCCVAAVVAAMERVAGGGRSALPPRPPPAFVAAPLLLLLLPLLLVLLLLMSVRW